MPIKLTPSTHIVSLALLATFGLFALPHEASAFWPFSSNAAAAGIPTPPVQSDSATFVKAATNLDPNPNKGLGAALQTSGGRALLAYAGPSGTIADVARSTPPDQISVYVVRRGDTLSEIADMFGVSVNTILWANNLKSARDVKPGDTLIILPISGIEYTVARGDTLKSLAKKYGADAGEIAQYNGLDSTEPLIVGTSIIIPGGEIALAPVPAASGKRAPSNPHRGGGGAVFDGFFVNPIPGGLLTQSIHGWNAVDIGAARGTPIDAAADGTVIIVRNGGDWNGGYGNYVVVTHSNSSQTLYSHLRSAVVSPGQQVSGGQLIGYVGMTGHTTGPHLHFEVRGAANPFRNCATNSVCTPQ